eukprot:5366928-Pleurochrysis_carterae.AAC.1
MLSACRMPVRDLAIDLDAADQHEPAAHSAGLTGAKGQLEGQRASPDVASPSCIGCIAAAVERISNVDPA